VDKNRTEQKATLYKSLSVLALIFGISLGFGAWDLEFTHPVVL
jgi:hypothetical protein